MKKWVPYATAIILIVTISLALKYLSRKTKLEFINSEEFLVPTETYRPPIINLPFVPHKPPVPFDVLPIPPEDIDQTITITIGETGVEANLVIDHEGNVYTTTNFPDGVEISVTKWKRKAFELGHHFGYSLVYSDGLYHCLSLDLIRLWSFSLGVDVGFNPRKISVSDALIGASIDYKIGSILKADLGAQVGYNLMNRKIYWGVNLRW